MVWCELKSRGTSEPVCTAHVKGSVTALDIVSSEKRSQMMRAVRSRDTKPELVLRRALHRQGFRFRLHRRDLPGTPDLVFPGRRSVIFVNGCFWHGHDCKAATLPKTRTDFWTAKIGENRARDVRNLRSLCAMGWRALVVWQCELNGVDTLGRIADWLDRAPSHKMLQDSSLADT